MKLITLSLIAILSLVAPAHTYLAPASHPVFTHAPKAHRKPRKPRRIIRAPHLTVRQVLAKALRITHKPRAWLQPLMWMAWQESKDHAYAVDAVSVTEAGIAQHAEGLMQVLPSTFAEFRMRGYGNIWSPLDNAVASVRYVAWRYGYPWGIPGIETQSYRGY